MKKEKPARHIVHHYLLNPTNPITVSLIGAGGTGSQVLTGLSRLNYSLMQLNHPGLAVTIYDDDKITAANLGRQLFAQSEIGQYKAEALVNRMNRFFGTNWKAVAEKVTAENAAGINACAHLVVSCVDKVEARFDIAKMLVQQKHSRFDVSNCHYWMDFGNSRFTGQVILSTVGQLQQPPSKQFKTVKQLLFVTDEFKNLLRQKVEHDEPSCSLAGALTKQDLYINSTLANMGCSLLWNMFREGMIEHRGFFLNLKTFQSQPIPLL